MIINYFLFHVEQPKNVPCGTSEGAVFFKIEIFLVGHSFLIGLCFVLVPTEVKGAMKNQPKSLVGKLGMINLGILP